MAIQNIKETINRITRRVLRGILGGYNRSHQRSGTDESIRYYITNIHLINRTGVGASFLLGLLLLLVITPLYNVTGVEDSEAATGTATDSSITFTSIKTTGCSSQGTPSTAVTTCVSLTPNGTTGTFATSKDSQKASFSISTTNYTGYTLTLKASTNATLSNGADTLATINTGSPSTGITADTFTNDTNYNNSWGYSPSYFNGSVNSSNLYYGISTTHDSTLDSTSSPNTTAKSYTIGLGARVDYSKSAGTYTNTSLVLAYIANPVNYVITYNKNTTDTVTNMPYSSANPQYTQKGDTSSTTITLASTIPVREGYNFKGWCSNQVADDTACTGVTYNPDGDGTNLSYGIDQTAMNEKTIYAVWETVYDGPYLQTMDFSDCPSTATLFRDKRDNEDYYIQKLADGNCWFLDNIRLDLVTASFDKLKGNTNATDEELGYMKNGGGSTSDKYATSGVMYSMGYSYSIPRINASDKDNTTKCTKYGSGSGKCGVYYNYCAASAGAYCYGNGGSDAGSPSGDAGGDVCPTGWRMPSGGPDGEFQALYEAYSSNATNFRDALSISLSGAFDAQLLYQGYAGSLWSSTYYNSERMHSLHSTASSVSPQSKEYRYTGFPVRCIKEKPKTYMQDYTLAQCKTDASSGNVTVYDRRDGSDYTVRYINDACWMTQNLRITGTISSTDSNFSTSSFNPCMGDLATHSASYVEPQCHIPTADLADENGNKPMDMYTAEQLGVWYNSNAASAGTVDAGQKAATEDICPSGWHLPSYQSFVGISGTVASGGGNYASLFLPIYGGYYIGSFSSANTLGFWWSRDSGRNATFQHYAQYNSGILGTGGDINKRAGFYVRCVRTI